MTYVDMVSPGTVDDKIVTALLQKMNIANEVMGEKTKIGSNITLRLSGKNHD